MENQNIKEIVKEEIEEAVQTGATKINIPIYNKFKGKTLEGHKTWKLSEEENKKIKTIAWIWIAGWIIGLVLFAYFKARGIGWVLLFACIFAPAIALWITMMRMAFRKNKEDPMEIKYYDVDYEQNYITGEGYDNTEEITKEEFFGRDN